MSAELSLLSRSFALVNDLSDRPRKGRSRPLPVLSLHADEGGGGEQVYDYLSAASKDCPHILLPGSANRAKTVRQIIFDVYDNLTWYQKSYGVLPLPRFGLLVLGIVGLREEHTEERSHQELEAVIRRALASPDDLADSLTLLGLSLLSSVGGIPGVTDAAVDVTAALASRSLAYARWTRAMKNAVGLTDHTGRTADTHQQVLRVIAWLVKEFHATGGVKRGDDEVAVAAVDRALCRALMADLRDAFTIGPQGLRLLRPCRVLIEDFEVGSAPERFCRYVTEIRAQWREEDAFDPLLIIAVDKRRQARGPARLGSASYADWSARAAGRLHRDDAWHYEVAVGGLDDLDVIRMLAAAGLAGDADTADRVLRRGGGNLTRVTGLVDRMRADGADVLDEPADEGAPS
ncbi:hypothetical protein [Phytomonospora endophytica]|uniref:Uncharacterized protein n=1 Tax=Phytomonospora endophytica TaxID=714109 RepID=A0A841FPD1_9ACTN|nr:hypothetical protein [Phytomonospora endophytica]MBB6037965.1 hypothetical protein [Phytomonospora endophytica]GIG68865.1 hypothetical protein Pen01_51600 [Phytomonospora endophytica]